MAEDPIVLALSNPDPEIPYPLAVETRSDVIMATGRSDYPNQVNNVLGFPYIFRGALDVRAKCINTEMLHAAVNALAELAHEPVPSQVARAYDLEQIDFGREYLIPTPLDHRVRQLLNQPIDGLGGGVGAPTLPGSIALSMLTFAAGVRVGLRP